MNELTSKNQEINEILFKNEKEEKGKENAKAQYHRVLKRKALKGLKKNKRPELRIYEEKLIDKVFVIGFDVIRIIAEKCKGRIGQRQLGRILDFDVFSSV